MTRLPMSVALVVVVLLSGCSPAEAPDTATTVDMELESLRQRAEEGDADAQYELGFVYETGLGVSQDDVEAARWYRLAADQGLAVAQYNLGVMYVVGRGVPEDFAEGARWFRLAADQGHIASQSRLGGLYLVGMGVLQDYEEAHRWTRLAADQGFASAQFNLGTMYDRAEGVPKDDVEAHKWLNLAASRFNDREQADDREEAVKSRDALAALMTPAQIAEAQTLAREWQAAFDARQE